jgi:hypothetical protein
MTKSVNDMTAAEYREYCRRNEASAAERKAARVDICRSYPPLPMPDRLPLLAAYHAAERTAEQTALLDAEIARAQMTDRKAERILKTWVRRGFAPFSAMDIAELEVLKRKHGSLGVAYRRVCGTEGL